MVLGLQEFDFNIPERNLPVVPLQGDATGVGLGKEWHSAELAFGDAALEIIAAENVIEVFHAIDFMLAFFRTDQEPNVVPLAHRLGGIKRFAGLLINRRLVQAV